MTRAMRTWPADGSTRAVLARTNRELLATVVAAVELGLPFRAPELPLPIEDERLDGLLERARAGARPAVPPPPLLALRRRPARTSCSRRATRPRPTTGRRRPTS